MNNIYDNIEGQEELDFPLLFFYNQPDLPPDEHADEFVAPDRTSPCVHDDASLYSDAHHLPSNDLLTYEPSDLRYPLAPHPGALQGNSPRIEITCSDLHHHRDHVHTNPVTINRPMLTVPGYDMPYRESQCLSPASSTSSTSWHSDGCSPCVSPNGGAGMAAVTEALQAIQASGSPNTSPRTSITEETFLDRRSSSPRSRSASPQGKRTYHQYQGPPSPRCGRDEPHEFCGHLDNLQEPLSSSLTKPIPTKMVRSSQEFYTENHGGFSSVPEVKKEFAVESCYFVPATWSSQALAGVCSMPASALPALDWPLPSQMDQYELRIEVEPRQHHRAHYETEGSRGAVKASSNTHPVVQLRGYSGREPLALQIFIGTADERNLRPHAFYQVHRITGKTVTTSSQERMLNGTKILEVALEPKENMRATIDCAGILKLRNADIELRKGETDVGRKNTRVRLVFRVHVPQPTGQWLSLQVSSHPIECSQRSAHEQPVVERQDLDHCSVLGGLQMILRGQNFTSESRVLFYEKTHGNLQTWESEAKVYRDKSTPSLLFLEIPPYREPNIYHPVKVNFHVLNGKKKSSQAQHFTYTPLSGEHFLLRVDESRVCFSPSDITSCSVPQIKAEPVEDYHYAQLGVRPVMGVSPPSCRLAEGYVLPGGRSHSGMYPNLQPAHYQLEHTRGTTSPSQFANVYQNITVSEGIQAASMFPTLDVSEFCPAVGHHQRAYGSRASPSTGRAPPVHHTYLSIQHQRTSSPVRHNIKRENLDQAYLDDVNAVIGKDLVHKNDF